MEDQNQLTNIKGIMLCNRPLDNVETKQDQKPFISRVYNHEQLGINPCKDDCQIRKANKKKNTAMIKHRQWLEGYKAQIENEKRDYQMTNQYQTIQSRSKSQSKKTLQPILDRQQTLVDMRRQQSMMEMQNSKQQTKKELGEFMDSIKMSRFIRDDKVRNLISDIKGKVEKMENKQKKSSQQSCSKLEQKFSNEIANYIMKNQTVMGLGSQKMLN